MKFNDISLSPDFIEDWEQAPSQIKTKVDRALNTWSITGSLPPSANTHRSHLVDPSLHIVYLTIHWRVIVRCDDNGMLHFVRLFDHDDMMRYFFP